MNLRDADHFLLTFSKIAEICFIGAIVIYFSSLLWNAGRLKEHFDL